MLSYLPVAVRPARRGFALRKLFELRKSPWRDVPGGAVGPASPAVTRGTEALDHAEVRHRIGEPVARKRSFPSAKDIDPLRLLVWSLFGALFIGVWAAIGWAIWAVAR